MLFDFDTFSRIAGSVYDEGNIYSLEECLGVFRCYFENYEKFRGRPHPPIKASQISRIMQIMPYETPYYIRCSMPDIVPEEYPLLIQLHFKTRYRGCDYNINHFFAGDIRLMRRYEANKGYE